MSKEKDLERFYNQRSDKFTIVLNDNELQLFKSARNIYVTLMTSENLSPVFLACIQHDRDYDEELMQYKTRHYHVVVQLGSICRIKTVINCLCNLFHCNENQISIDKCNSIVMQTRYLCHLDDFDKAQYFQNEVECNDKDVLNRYFNLVIVRDLHDLIAVVKRYHYILEDCMCNIAHWDKWRKYVLDLIREHRTRY